ncbi:Myosin ID heavy chain [Gossypium arboreum]|uniref:Myosin ID heavy chain n=1 Tax=Gossypium arboreum TaxID=29729 RepID=A0A0B0MX72_GOSAR|nr:Myosin ID heavy chain [Gossypium arboreum]
MSDSNKNQALDNIKERFALEVLDNYVKKALEKIWRNHKSALKKEYSKKNISLEEKLRNVLPRMLRYQWEDAVRFWNSKKGETQAEVQRLRDQMAQMQVSTVEQIAQLKVEVASREAEMFQQPQNPPS